MESLQMWPINGIALNIEPFKNVLNLKTVGLPITDLNYCLCDLYGCISICNLIMFFPPTE